MNVFAGEKEAYGVTNCQIQASFMLRNKVDVNQIYARAPVVYADGSHNPWRKTCINENVTF